MGNRKPLYPEHPEHPGHPASERQQEQTPLVECLHANDSAVPVGALCKRENVEIDNVDFGLRRGMLLDKPTSPNALRTTENLCRGLEIIATNGALTREITGIASDSRKVAPGNVFVCYHGIAVDGHRFIAAAIKNGAIAVIGEKALGEVEIGVEIGDDVTYIQVPDGRRALALLSANWHGNPARRLKLIGVTGTNGKTTTVHLIHAILTASGKKAAMLGTVGHHYGDVFVPTSLTTPDAFELHALFEQFVASGIEYVVMETSSQGLAQQRLAGLTFDTAVFTNLTQEHLDYHASMEAYLAAKLMLFTQLAGDGVAILNGDAPASAQIAKAVGARDKWTYALEKSADFCCKDVELSLNRLAFTAVTPLARQRAIPVVLRLLGEYNLYNALAAIGVGLRYDCPIPAIQEGLAATVVPGRFELVDRGQDFAVIVDYAHTPDGLENVLRAARGITQRKLISVFGCGGDRDTGKRPEMGQISAEIADYSVITSDNPRTEEPAEIIAQIVSNLPHDTHYVSILQRREAIHHAIATAKSGDVVVIAGKGHEDYQEIHGQRFPFDDRQVALLFLCQSQCERIGEPVHSHSST